MGRNVSRLVEHEVLERAGGLCEDCGGRGNSPQSLLGQFPLQFSYSSSKGFIQQAARMAMRRQTNKVFGPIIILDSVQMVNGVIGGQWHVMCFFPDQNFLRDIPGVSSAFSSPGMILLLTVVDQDVAFTMLDTATPIGGMFSYSGFHGALLAETRCVLSPIDYLPASRTVSIGYSLFLSVVCTPVGPITVSLLEATRATENLPRKRRDFHFGFTYKAGQLVYRHTYESTTNGLLCQ